MLIAYKNPVKKQKSNEVTISKDIEKENNIDPLSFLYQMDYNNSFPIQRDALVLIIRLLQNVEEYYMLKEIIRETMDKDETDPR